MNKSDLLSIGEFSQISGATIKALHYYEKIRILSPTWIDPDSGYRYYTLQQLHYIDAINLFLDLDIRLNLLPEYINGSCSNIDFEKILRDGKNITLEKLKELENKMRYIDYLEEQLNVKPVISENMTSPASLWLIPYNKLETGFTLAEAMKKILQDIRPYNLKFHHTYGRIMFCNGKEQRIYYFANVKIPAGTRFIHENIFYLPKGEYRSIELTSPSLEKASKIFKDLFEIPYDKIILETVQTQTADSPRYLLSCLLPVNN